MGSKASIPLLALLLASAACGSEVLPPAAPGQVAVTTFAADPAFSVPNAPVTLSWQTQNATTCAITPTIGVIPGADLDQGQLTVSPDLTNRFVITCQGLGGPTQASLYVAMIGFDTDLDLVTDTAEIVYGTDPFIDDTDGDSLTDGEENRNHDTVADAFETDARLFDTDGDGLSDGVEDANADGVVNAGETDPLNFDTDGDEIPDGTEDENGDRMLDAGESNPLDVDTDDDSLADGVEDANRDGHVDPGETDPNDPDSDDNDICDGPRMDNDANGIDPVDDCVNPV